MPDVFQSRNDIIVIESDDDEDRQLVPSDDPLDDSDIEILLGSYQNEQIII
jgi:hypothetical protein